MAESKGALLAKSVQKHAGRAKEKILQNLGKVDRTADEIFDEHLQNFTRQQNSANRLQKEFNNYIRCIRAVQTASKSLMEAVADVYEGPWSGHDVLTHQTGALEMLWQDFSHKLGDQVLIPLNTYQAQFPEMRKKIDKRGRKLVDFDSQRHSFQGLQANASKKRDDVKVTKGREQLEEAKRTYEQLNSELHDELPALYDSRVLFLVTNLQTLFTSEQLFHQETSKVYAELEAIVDKLATDSQRGSYSIKKMNSVLPSSGTLQSNSPKNTSNKTQANNLNNSKPASPINNVPDSPKSATTPSSTSPLNTSSLSNNSNNSSSVIMTPSTPPPTSPAPPTSPPPPLTPVNDNKMAAASQSPANLNPSTNSNRLSNTDNTNRNTNTTAATMKLSNGNHHTTNNEAGTNDGDMTVTDGGSGPAAAVTGAAVLPVTAVTTAADGNKNTAAAGGGDLYDIPVSATTTDLPPGVLYRVKATYKYTREDVDELSFEVGDTIRVIEYEDPEEQEEGWLMGLKEGSNEKGMFPANFTRPI